MWTKLLISSSIWHQTWFCSSSICCYWVVWDKGMKEILSHILWLLHNPGESVGYLNAIKIHLEQEHWSPPPAHFNVTYFTKSKDAWNSVLTMSLSCDKSAWTTHLRGGKVSGLCFRGCGPWLLGFIVLWLWQHRVEHQSRCDGHCAVEHSCSPMATRMQSLKGRDWGPDTPFRAMALVTHSFQIGFVF